VFLFFCCHFTLVAVIVKADRMKNSVCCFFITDVSVQLTSTSAGSAVFRGTWFFTPRCGIRCLPRNLLLPAEKCRITRVFATFVSNSSLFGFFLVLPLIKQNLVIVTIKLTFVIIVTNF